MDEEIRAAIAEKPIYRTWCDAHPRQPPQICRRGPSRVQTLNFHRSTLNCPRSWRSATTSTRSSSSSRRSPKALSPPAPWATTRRSPCSLRRPRLLYSYFKQLFAQVTNPPIDSIREKSVMSLTMYLGGRLGLFEELPQTKGFVELDTPILSDAELAALATVPALKGHVATLSVLFDAAGGPDALERFLKELATQSPGRRRAVRRHRHHSLRPRRHPRKDRRPDAARRRRGAPAARARRSPHPL